MHRHKWPTPVPTCKGRLAASYQVQRGQRMGTVARKQTECGRLAFAQRLRRGGVEPLLPDTMRCKYSHFSRVGASDLCANSPP